MLFVPFFYFADISVVEGYKPVAFILFVEFPREKLFDDDEVCVHELIGKSYKRLRRVLYDQPVNCITTSHRHIHDDFKTHLSSFRVGVPEGTPG
jgi:hypothetical protein